MCAWLRAKAPQRVPAYRFAIDVWRAFWCVPMVHPLNDKTRQAKAARVHVSPSNDKKITVMLIHLPCDLTLHCNATNTLPSRLLVELLDVVQHLLL